MRVTAAVLYDVNKPYSIETVELDPPKRGEVLIKVGAAGVCRRCATSLSTSGRKAGSPKAAR